MFKKYFGQKEHRQASASPVRIDVIFNEHIGSNGRGIDDNDVSRLARNYRRMHQAILFLIGCVIVYMVGRLVHDVILANAGNLFLQLPDSANALGLV
jgi:hypothetical protein